MPAALYKQLGKTQQEFKDLLQYMYQVQKMSQADIAKHFSCNITCIEGWFKRFDLSTRSLKEAARNNKQRIFDLSNKESLVLDGLLLSDIHIETGHFQSRASFGFKHKEFADSVIKYTKTLQWSEPKYNKISLGWHSKTKYCINLHNLRQKWYPFGKKIVPKDIKITPTTMLWWYLGDGYIAKYGAVLCTDSFDRVSNHRLVKLIISEGIPCHLTPRNRIRIEGNRGIDLLLDYIGPSPVECYKYKWGERK